MNVTYIIRFDGFHEKSASAVDKTLRELIAFFPKRIRMASASVELPAAAMYPALADTTDTVTVTETEMEEAVERGDVTPTVEAKPKVKRSAK